MIKFGVVPLRIGIACICFCYVGSGFAQSELRAGEQPVNIANSNGLLSFNFVDVDISSALAAVGQATGQIIIIDPKVQGSISLKTSAPASSRQVLDLLAAALRVREYTLVDNGKYLKVLTSADAKYQAVSVTGQGSRSEGNTLSTQVFRLNYESAVNMLPILKPLMSPNNAIAAYGGNNSLVITEYVENLQRLGKIIEALDSPVAGEVEMLKILNGSCTEIVGILSKAFESISAGADKGQNVSFVADPRTNHILVKTASAGKLAQVKALVLKLDAKTERGGNIYVIPVRNANATRLAETLRGLISGSGSGAFAASAEKSFAPALGIAQTSNTPAPRASESTSAGMTIGNAATEKSGAGVASSIIQADIPSNSLVLIANDVIYRNLLEVVKQLDVRVPQVYVESLFVEVSSESAKEFGIQWQNIVGSSDKLFYGTNFATAGANIVNQGAEIASLTSLGRVAGNPANALKGGLNVGYLKDFGGVFGLAALARAFEGISGVNVLSAPNLVTLDNEEGKIVIGRNVPFITGQYAQTGAATSVSPFQTIERKDVGLTLRFKPQVTSGGLIKLQIFQESSSIVDGTLTNSSGVITSKRAIESNVMAEDGQIVALGGLMENSSTDGTDKVPGLGDVPLFGALFRSEVKKQSKTNLMIFLRPYVIRNAEQSREITNVQKNFFSEIDTFFPPKVGLLPEAVQ